MRTVPAGLATVTVERDGVTQDLSFRLTIAVCDRAGFRKLIYLTVVLLLVDISFNLEGGRTGMIFSLASLTALTRAT